MNIRVILFFSCLLSLPLTGNAQHKFFKVFTDNGYDYAESVCELPDSSFAITGASSSFQDSPAQVYLLRIDKQGNRLWSKHYGGSESDWGKRIFHVPNDGFYIAGHSNSFFQTFSFLLLKVDEEGELLWTRHYPYEGNAFLTDAVMLSDTSMVLVGKQYGLNGGETSIAFRVNKAGDKQWEQPAFNGHYQSVIADANDNLYATGQDFSTANGNEQAVSVMSWDKFGALRWENNYGSGSHFQLNELRVRGNQLYGVGHERMENGKRAILTYISSLEGDMSKFAVEYNNGDFYLSTFTAYGNELKFYTAMQAAEADFGLYADGEDVIIYRYTQHLDWNEAFVYPSSTGDDKINDMIACRDGGAIAVGYNTRFSTGGNGATALKIGPNDDFPASHTAPISESLVQLNSLPAIDYSIYPNPGNGKITLKGFPEGYFLRLYNNLGQEIHTLELTTEHIDLHHLVSGHYIIHFEHTSLPAFSANYVKID